MGNVATSVEARNKSLVRDRFEAWAQGNGSPFELLADDASWTSKCSVGPLSGGYATMGVGAGLQRSTLPPISALHEEFDPELPSRPAGSFRPFDERRGADHRGGRLRSSSNGPAR